MKRNIFHCKFSHASHVHVQVVKIPRYPLLVISSMLIMHNVLAFILDLEILCFVFVFICIYLYLLCQLMNQLISNQFIQLISLIHSICIRIHSSRNDPPPSPTANVEFLESEWSITSNLVSMTTQILINLLDFNHWLSILTNKLNFKLKFDFSLLLIWFDYKAH